MVASAIRLPMPGLFLDDRFNSSANGAIVQGWKGNGSGNGARLYLSHYTGSGNQKWDTAGWRIHYNPAASSKVVDDPAFGAPGTQLSWRRCRV